MKYNSFLNLNQCNLSNNLWSNFISKIGINKARLAVHQSLDLQSMNGNIYTLPVLILETCGSALVSADYVRNFIGLSCDIQGMLLIYSSRLNSIQLLRYNNY